MSLADGPLTLALPSKGRLQKMTTDFLGACGIRVESTGGAREYAARLRGVDGIDVVFLRPDEVPLRLAQGTLHLGVTGEDLLREHGDASEHADILQPLGFGRARLVTAVPRSWIDVRTMADLEEVAAHYREHHGRALRVATKYARLTRAFFTSHGIRDFVVVGSLGATEGAPASGDADLIVDVTSTGATLVQNHLKIVSDGVIVRSEACLVAGLSTPWGEGQREAARQLLDRIEAHLQGRGLFSVSFQPPASGALGTELQGELSGDLGCRAFSPGTFLCPEKRLYDAVEKLRGAGCRGIAASRAEYLFADEHPETWLRLCASIDDRLSGPAGGEGAR